VSQQPANTPAPVAGGGGPAPGQASSAQQVQTSPTGPAATQPASSGSRRCRASASNYTAAETSRGKLCRQHSAGAPFEVIVRPKDSAWVSVKSDGKYVVRGIIKPPDVRTIHATGRSSSTLVMRAPWKSLSTARMFL